MTSLSVLTLTLCQAQYLPPTLLETHRLESIMSRSTKLILPALLISLLAACDSAKQAETTAESAAPQQNAMPANHPPINQAAPANHAIDWSNLQGGKAEEVMTSGGYTYVKTTRDGKEVWAAGPESKIEVGNMVAWQGNTVMRNFTSKSLGKTFPEITFVSSFINPSQMSSADHAQMMASRPAPAASGGSMGGTVKEVLNGGGYTYVKVEMNGKDVWAAGPMSAFSVGDPVSWDGGSIMNNFTSSSLGKTFEAVYFVGAFSKSAPNAAPVATLNTGTVKQVIASAGYSYVEVQTADKQLWLAAPQSAVKANDKITWANGSVMKNFKSSSLDRTFNEIVFVDSVQTATN